MINKLKLRGKLLFVFISILILSNSIIVLSVILNIQSQSSADLLLFQEQAKQKYKDELQNYVSIAYEIVQSQYKKLNDSQFLEKTFSASMKERINFAESSIQPYINALNHGTINREQAMEQSLRTLRLLSSKTGEGFFWVNDLEAPYPKMLLNQAQPELEGTILTSSSAQGFDLVSYQAIALLAKEKGEGFWETKDLQKTSNKKVPRLSYGRWIHEFNWVLGTGLYLENMEEETKRKTLDILKEIRYDNHSGYFWLNDTTEPYPAMIMHPTNPALDGTILNDKKYESVTWDSENTGRKNLFRSMVEVCKGESGEGYVQYQWPKPTASGGITDQTFPKMSYVKLFKPWGWVIGTGVYIDSIYEEIQIRNDNLNKHLQMLMIIIISISIGIIVIMIVLIVFLSHLILKPMKNVTEVIQAISKDGDFTRSIMITSSDEVGEMAKQFNSFVTNFRGIIEKFKHMNDILNQAIQDLNVSSKEIATTSNQQAAAVKEIVTTMEDNDKLSKGIANRISEVAKIATKTKENVGEGFSIIEKNMTKMDEIRKTNDKTITGIKSLGDQIDSIWDVVNIINGIADQTKIIAFNAELEASAAGDVGKNFQIVATEIRRLADNTVSSTSEIKQKINDMQRASDHLILASEDGTGKIQEGWDLSLNLRKVFEEIFRSSDITSTSANEIVLSVDQQVKAIEQILLTLKQISEGIDNFVLSTKSTTQASEGLKEIGKNLDGVVGEFKV